MIIFIIIGMILGLVIMWWPQDPPDDTDPDEPYRAWFILNEYDRWFPW